MRKFGFFLLYAFLWVLTLLPLRILYVLSDLIFFLMFYVVKYRRKVVYNNLSNAFPEKSEEEKKRISKAFFHHLCDYFIETLKQMHISEKEMRKRVVLESDYIQRHAQEKKNVVIMTGHNANWEWLSFVSTHDDYRWLVPYHPLQNSPYFDNFMLQLRNRLGAEPIPMKTTYKRLMEVSRQGDLFVIGMIADQSPPNPKNRHWITFLNQDTAVMEGSERIAQKTDAAVVFVKMMKIKRGHYKVDVIPITEHPKEEKDLYITQKYYELLEEQIREQPECWLWSHRRWKRQRPADEKLIKK